VPGPPPSDEEVRTFLTDLHRAPIEALEPLSGGFWSTAFGYRAGGRELVARFGPIRAGFEADRAAMAYATDDLPVPEVLDIGDAFGGAYAISRRHHGRFLEDLRVEEGATAGPMLARLLAALRHTPDVGGAGSSWRRWLVDSLEEDPAAANAGWRKALATRPGADELFRTVAARVRELASECPERRDLVHGDLLHRNVLVTSDTSRVEAVFSWKCSMRGDFLFDTAWCTFWGESFHPGIAALDPWRLTWETEAPDTGEARRDAALRHHCYELHIGATHLGWHAWTGDDAGLAEVAAHTVGILERGPRPDPD
jgi:aminoglycoside phosphotransferase (APT) family kinase protein